MYNRHFPPDTQEKQPKKVRVHKIYSIAVAIHHAVLHDFLLPV